MNEAEKLSKILADLSKEKTSRWIFCKEKGKLKEGYFKGVKRTVAECEAYLELEEEIRQLKNKLAETQSKLENLNNYPVDEYAEKVKAVSEAISRLHPESDYREAGELRRRSSFLFSLRSLSKDHAKIK